MPDGCVSLFNVTDGAVLPEDHTNLIGKFRTFGIAVCQFGNRPFQHRAGQIVF